MIRLSFVIQKKTLKFHYIQCIQLAQRSPKLKIKIQFYFLFIYFFTVRFDTQYLTCFIVYFDEELTASVV